MQGEARYLDEGVRGFCPHVPPLHTLGCHQSLGTPHPREGVSLTLLLCSSCGAGDRWETDGCCPGWQRRLGGFLLSIKPRVGQSVGAAPAARASFCPIALPRCGRGNALQCTPVPGSGPRGEAVLTSPISGGFKCCFLQRVPGHPGDNRAVLVIDMSRQQSVCPAGRREGDVAQRQSARFACGRSWVRSPASPRVLFPPVPSLRRVQAGAGALVLSRHCGPALPTQGPSVG